MSDVSQAVTEEKTKPEEQPKVVPEAEAGGSDAQDKTLDELLKEGEKTFEEKSKPEDEPEKKDDTVLERRIEKLEKGRIKEQVDKGVSEAVKAIRESNEALENVPDELVEGYLYKKAEDSRFLLAFNNREADPSAWNGILKAAGKDFAGLIGKVHNPELSASRQAAQAASRGVSTEPPPEEKVDENAMSDAELDAHRRKLDAKKASG